MTMTENECVNVSLVEFRVATNVRYFDTESKSPMLFTFDLTMCRYHYANKWHSLI